MAPGSCTHRSLCNNFPADFTEEQDKLAGPQDPIKRSDAGNNKALISSKALTPFETPTLSLVSFTKDLFTKFMKAFMKSAQA